MMMKNQGKDFLSYFRNSFLFFSSSKFSKERLAQFRNLSERPDIYELLSNAIGNDFYKEIQ
jgi:hypothetical protein